MSYINLEKKAKSSVLAVVVLLKFQLPYIAWSTTVKKFTIGKKSPAHLTTVTM